MKTSVIVFSLSTAGRRNPIFPLVEKCADPGENLGHYEIRHAFYIFALRAFRSTVRNWLHRITPEQYGHCFPDKIKTPRPPSPSSYPPPPRSGTCAAPSPA